MAVLPHEIHASVINTGQPYGCNSRPDFQPIAYGAACYGSQAFPHVMSHDCRFDLSETDPRCTGCHRVGQGREYDEMEGAKDVNGDTVPERISAGIQSNQHKETYAIQRETTKATKARGMSL